MFKKFKNLNKKWYLLIFLVIILGACGGLATKYYLRQQHQKNIQADVAAQVERSVEQDLLYLDNSATLKLSQDQAKAILPLVEKIAAANTNSSPSINDLAKQVYENLTPAQYQVLTVLDNGKSATGNIGKEGQDGKKDNRREDNREFGKTDYNTKGIADPKAGVLSDMVIKMLKNRSTKITKTPVS